MKQLTPRRSDRKMLLVDVQVRTLRGGIQFVAHTLDLGEAGMGLFAGRFVEIGQRVEVRFPNGRKMLGAVANVRVETDGNLLGIAFAVPLEQEELTALKKSLQAR